MDVVRDTETKKKATATCLAKVERVKKTEIVIIVNLSFE